MVKSEKKAKKIKRSYKDEQKEETRLLVYNYNYNCAHLRSTKESLTIEYFEKKLIFWVKNFYG